MHDLMARHLCPWTVSPRLGRPQGPGVIGNAILYRNGVPIASLEAGTVVPRQELEEGARVGDDLTYHAPPRREDPPSRQVSLF